VTPLNTAIDFKNRRAIVVEGHDTIMTYTTVHDVAAVVARAVDLDGEWPVIGGISGNKLPISELLKIGEKVRGMLISCNVKLSYWHYNAGCSFTIDEVKLEDLENGVLTSSWRLETSHSSAAGHDVEKMLEAALIGTLIGGVKGAWDVSDQFNQLLPDFKFTQIEDFLTKVWKGEP
jgi:hypothetical protein